MTSPKVFLEELLGRRGELYEQLHLMENHLAEPQRSPSFGTLSGSEPTTKQSIARVKSQIAELDELISNVGIPRA